MQSFSLLPPVLENQLEAVAYDSSAAGHNVEIKFSLPAYAVFDEIKHIQVSIREKTTNNIAINTSASPDQQVLYLSTTQEMYDATANICTVLVPYSSFSGGNIMPNVEYNIQVRFGSGELTWIGNVPSFATWRAEQVSTGCFGEWSNITTLFCYNPDDLSISAVSNDDSFIPTITFSYQLKGIDDSLDKINVRYSYQDFYQKKRNTEDDLFTNYFGGNYTTNSFILNSSGQTDKEGNQVFQFELPVGRITKINVQIEGYTKKNIKLDFKTVQDQLILEIPPVMGDSNWQVIGGSLENITASMTAEEQSDGGLFFEGIIPVIPTNPPENIWIWGDTYSVYRVNLFTLEAIKLFTDSFTKTEGLKFRFCDYSVEMGEDYIYVVVLQTAEHNFLLETLDFKHGYGRLMRMESILLTTKDHQLKLQGNVKLSGLKRNTSDAFQTTIGNQYPFYSRGSVINYRTFNIEGLITILFNKTSKFFDNDEENGLRWIDNGKIVILNRDIYHTLDYTHNTRRVNSKAPLLKGTIDIFGGDERGPVSRNDDEIFTSQTMFDDTSHTDEMIYIERKFREYVMQWLSDGRPKLFRSETEGNMIVMLTGINFTPYDASGRMVYQMSVTATEIAEYNNENLIKYDLLSVDLIRGFWENLLEDDGVKKPNIDPDLGLLYVDDTNEVQNGSGHFEYRMLSPLTIQDIDNYNDLVESDDYQLYASQPIIYMKLLYQDDTYNNLHYGKFVSLDSLKAEYQLNSNQPLLKELLAALIKNDVLDIVDYPELEDLAFEADYVDWVVNFHYRSILKRLGFGASLYTLRANVTKNTEDEVKGFIDQYFNIANLPYKEVYSGLTTIYDADTRTGINIADDSVVNNIRPTEEGLYLVIDKYRNGNQLAIGENKATNAEPLTANVQLENSSNQPQE